MIKVQWLGHTIRRRDAWSNQEEPDREKFNDGWVREKVWVARSGQKDCPMV